MLTKRAKAYL